MTLRTIESLGDLPEMHRLLAQMYVTDPGFTEHYERRAPGLAKYVHDAILATSSA